MSLTTEGSSYYTLRGNPRYKITSRLEIIDMEDGRKLVSGSDNKTFKVSLYGMPAKTYDKEFLYKASIIQIFINPKFPYHIDYLRFVDNIQANPKQFYIPVFTKPQIYNGNQLIRFIPGNSYLACSPDGTIYRVNKEGVLSVVKPYVANKDSYPIIQFYNGKNLLVHRLVALAWCTPNDVKELCIVDHKDANKQNFISSNLRWVSYSENTQATKEQGVHPNNEKCKCRNIHTGEVKEFLSKTDLSMYMGRSRFYNTNIELRPGKLWRGDNGIFEVKLADDDTDWVYYDVPEGYEFRSSTEIPNNPLKQRQTSIKITMSNGDIKVFNNFEDLFKVLLEGIPCDYNNICKYEELLRNKYPNIKIEMDNKRGYEAKNYDTGEIVEAGSISIIASKIGTNKSMANKYCKLGKILNSWLIRVKNEYMDIPWPDIKEELPANTTIQYELIDTNTDDRRIISSKRKLALAIGCERNTISVIISRTPEGQYSTYKNFKFKEISRTRQDLSVNNKRSLKEGLYIKESY